MISTPITFFDFETTGTETRYDQPIQIGGIRTDADLHILDEFDLRCRLDNATLPAPQALLVHGVGIREIEAAPLSFYQAMSSLTALMEQWGPSCYVAYNGLKYDDEVKRHSFYRTLHQPYAAQMNGNSRFDAMRLMHAVHLLSPGMLTLPTNAKGKPTFALALVAAANGFEGHIAHDAVGDARAMIHLAQLVRNQAPDIWRLLSIWTSKPEVERMLRANQLLIQAAWSAKPCFYPLVPTTQNREVASEWVAVDVRSDPKALLTMSPEQLLKEMTTKGPFKPLKRIKANAMPILLPGDHALVQRAVAVDRKIYEERARLVLSDLGFAGRVQEALQLHRRSFAESPYVEDQLYGAFFPTSDDEENVSLFHRVTIEQKAALVERLRDPRARAHGWRILFNDFPSAMPEHELTRCRQDRWNRLMTNAAVPWMTVPKALAEIAKLRNGCVGDAKRILDEYESYLLALKGREAA